MSYSHQHLISEESVEVPVVHVVQQQPMMPNQVMMVQPGQHIMGQPVLRDWSTDLCACFDDCCGCMYGCFCATCLLSSIASRLGEGACCVTCVPGVFLALRTKLRTIYGIRGNVCNDGCCIIACCGPCALCQMDRELKAMGLN